MSKPNSLAMGSMATLRTMRSMLHSAKATAKGTVVLRKREPVEHGHGVMPLPP